MVHAVSGFRAMHATPPIHRGGASLANMRRKVTCESHYEYGFDPTISATGHPSMFLKGGNDSNFGMVITDVLYNPKRGTPGVFEDESEHDVPSDVPFQPTRVTFYVRTDSPNSGVCFLPR